MLTDEMRARVKGAEPLAAAIARSFKPSTMLDADDLKAAANLGLCEAALRYDPAFGTKFSTLAVPYIRGRIHEARRVLDHLKRGERETAAEFDVSKLPPRSLAEPLRTQSAFEETLTIEESIVDPEDKYASICENMILASSLARLPTREQHIIREYFWGDKTFCDISKTMGISEARVYQLYRTGLARLRNYLS